MSNSAKLTGSAPVLLVKDIVKAANHYRDAMGFEYERFWGEPPFFVILYRDGMYLANGAPHPLTLIVQFRCCRTVMKPANTLPEPR